MQSRNSSLPVHSSLLSNKGVAPLTAPPFFAPPPPPLCLRALSFALLCSLYSSGATLSPLSPGCKGFRFLSNCLCLCLCSYLAIKSRVRLCAGCNGVQGTMVRRVQCAMVCGVQYERMSTVHECMSTVHEGMSTVHEAYEHSARWYEYSARLYEHSA